MKKIVIFLGVPGSGKGTQAKLLSKKFGFRHLSTGDLLRARAEQPGLSPEEKTLLAKITADGQLAPDEMIYSLVFKEIDKALTEHHGVVLDGAIRTLSQAKEYQKYFSEHGLEKDVEAVEVAIPDEESFHRLFNRRICSSCGEILTIPRGGSLPSCPKCGGKLVARHDDNETTVKRRVEEQGNRAIAPLRDYYTSLGIMRIIDGTKTVGEVSKEIESVLK